MAKFSILKDHEEDDDDDEQQQQEHQEQQAYNAAAAAPAADDDDVDEVFSIRSPKRRRTSLNPLPSAPPTPTTFHDHHDHVADDDVTPHSQLSDPEGPTGSACLSVILSDPDVLDCSICFDPLTIPVFQCDNGHITCSACCTKLGDKCPSCCGKIGYNRCRAIEKVIESVRVPCSYLRYGCSEKVSYCKKHEHEEICIYAPCSCPIPGCIFRGSPRRLSQHMSQEHKDLVVRFCYDSVFSVIVGTGESFVVLQEESDGVLFILIPGDAVTVRCIDPIPSQGRFAYDLVLRSGDSSLRFQSFTHCTTGQIRNPPPADYILIPGCFYQLDGRLRLDICIWSKDSSHGDVTEALNAI